MNERRLRVLLSAYACSPVQGSEPAVGWNVASTLAAVADVWVLTRRNNKDAIENEVRNLGMDRPPRFIYFDLPGWARWWKRGARGMRVYYYIWQLCIYFLARRYHRQLAFDVVHHITFATYWLPSFLVFIRAPFVWGPVGGGEACPLALLSSCGLAGIGYEVVRWAVARLNEFNPLVRLTARRSALAIGSTPDTCKRLKGLAAPRVTCSTQLGLTSRELEELSPITLPVDRPIRFISVGRLIHWKGFHLAIRAFARLADSASEYWIVGDGPDAKRLKNLAHALGLGERVKFFGSVDKASVPEFMTHCHILLHPSLHDSGGAVCLEAMAMGRPIICIQLGGPAAQVSSDCGIQVPVQDPANLVSDLSRAMYQLASDPELICTMGEAGRKRAVTQYCWDRKSGQILQAYKYAINCRRRPAET